MEDFNGEAKKFLINKNGEYLNGEAKKFLIISIFEQKKSRPLIVLDQKKSRPLKLHMSFVKIETIIYGRNS